MERFLIKRRRLRFCKEKHTPVGDEAHRNACLLMQGIHLGQALRSAFDYGKLQKGVQLPKEARALSILYASFSPAVRLQTDGPGGPGVERVGDSEFSCYHRLYQSG
jgi:hypothetical protein